MGELNVANCFEYYLLWFMLNINLTYYNIIKSSVDGDRSQVFWITQKLKPLRKKYKTEFQYHPFRFNQNAKYFKRNHFPKIQIGTSLKWTLTEQKILSALSVYLTSKVKVVRYFILLSISDHNVLELFSYHFQRVIYFAIFILPGKTCYSID